MTKKSRLNPNKTSRATLKQLQDKGILERMKVGLRHIIKSDGIVVPLGPNIGFPTSDKHMPNFYPGAARTYSAVVTYNGERAELSATLGRQNYEGHVLDVSSHFPCNQLATDLLVASFTSSYLGYEANSTVYGDAVLVTDNRMHWVFRPYGAAAEDVEDFNELLSTSRKLYKDGNRTWIFFDEEPNQADIVALKMRWL
jgi:hypothetical protein